MPSRSCFSHIRHYKLVAYDRHSSLLPTLCCQYAIHLFLIRLNIFTWLLLIFVVSFFCFAEALKMTMNQPFNWHLLGINRWSPSCTFAAAYFSLLFNHLHEMLFIICWSLVQILRFLSSLVCQSIML